MEESNVEYYGYAILAVLGIIGYLIRRMLSKKTIAELKNYAGSHNYVYHEKLDDSLAKKLDFPKFYSSVKVYNYLEVPEKDWLTIWGDCDRVIKTDKAPASTARATFFIFNFNTIIVPEFEITDNQGLLDSLGNLFSGKVIKLDGNFSSSYNLKSPYEVQVKKFFTEKVKKAFLNLDKKHLPDERDLNLKDLGNMITGHFSKGNGVQIYGGKKKLLILCSEKTSLTERQKFYKIASGVANVIVKENSNKKSSDSSLSNEPQDEMSKFIAAQQAKFDNVPSPTSTINQYNQLIQEEHNNQTALYNDSSSVSLPDINDSNQPDNDYGSQKTSSSDLHELNDSSDNNLVQENRNDPSDQLLILAAMMVVDRSIHRNELKIIVDYGEKLGMERTAIEEVVNASKNHPDNILRSIKAAKIYKDEELMHLIVRVAFADGKIANEELEMLRLIAKKMDYSNEELKVILEEEKRNFYS